jgi:hypothetical protein
MRNKSVTVTIEGIQNSRRTYATKAVLTHLLERDGLLCQLCQKSLGEEDLSIDHIMPQGVGGRHTLDNFQLAHGRCNKSKGRGSHANLLFKAGIIPVGIASTSAEYRILYAEARDAIETRWWRKWGSSLVGSGRRYSISEWKYIEDDVYAKVWKLRVRKGEEAALAYDPKRSEFSRRSTV